MTSSAPLVPAEVDLTNLPYMPILIARLKQSRAWLACKRRPELAFYMMNLWTAAWHGRPAASLENDDDVLADMAMCQPQAWKKVRADVLRGWVICSDGRLYHSVVAEQALVAWGKKTAHRDKMEAARAAKEQRRLEKEADGGPSPPADPKPRGNIRADKGTIKEPDKGSIIEPDKETVTGLKGREGKGREGKGYRFPPNGGRAEPASRPADVPVRAGRPVRGRPAAAARA